VHADAIVFNREGVCARHGVRLRVVCGRCHGGGRLACTSTLSRWANRDNLQRRAARLSDRVVAGPSLTLGLAAQARLAALGTGPGEIPQGFVANRVLRPEPAISHIRS
jgi:hypothetical protein